MKCFMGKIVANCIALFGATAIFTACQEETFGVTEAEVATAKYNRKFVEEFGQPAEGHQWGFDAAAAAMSMVSGGEGTRASSITTHVYKYDFNVGSTNLRTWQLYGNPAVITPKEHDEVYAWFSNHKVYWAKTPAYLDDNVTMGTTRTNQACPEGSSEPFEGGDALAYQIDTLNPGYGSLLEHEINFKNRTMGPTYNFGGMSLEFYNGWVQNVAGDDQLDEEDGNGQKISAVGHMDYVAFMALNNPSNREHIYDFNASHGWGTSASNRGVLVLESNFNVAVYKSSLDGGKLHDKYYIVYLEGEDYAGYYLGFDLEGYSDSKNNMYAEANGICNDWIIKISDVGNTAYNPARVMCEDLGSSFDVDFNDIVFDVQAQNSEVTITVQAVGGTKEVEIWYGEKNGTDSNGNSSYRLEKNGKTEMHAIFEENVDCPINVTAIDAGVNGKAPIVWKLAFNGQGGDNYDHRFQYGFSFADINIYVRQDQNAEWANLTNLSKKMNVPLRICVPTETRWCQEHQDIRTAYTMFMDWVKDPSETFWDGPTNAGMLQ